MFISASERYDKNVRQALSYTAAPAVMTRRDGQQEPGVILHSLKNIRGVLPAAEALRLANEIADALAAHRTNKPGEAPQ